MKLFHSFLTGCSVILFCLLSGCSKSNDNPLPAPTQNGSNILACMKNGKACIYRGHTSWSYSHGVMGGHLLQYGYEIYATNDAEHNNSLFMYVNQPAYEITKKYPLSVTSNIVHTSIYYDYDLGADDNHPIYPDSSTSFIIFTKLTDSIIAGTFEFHGVNDEHIVVDMTKGFFDIAVY